MEWSECVSWCAWNYEQGLPTLWECTIRWHKIHYQFSLRKDSTENWSISDIGLLNGKQLFSRSEDQIKKEAIALYGDQFHVLARICRNESL